jgi:hypothetical protein
MPPHKQKRKQHTKLSFKNCHLRHFFEIGQTAW